MFTRHDKIKERVMFFTENQQISEQISKNQSFEPVGVSFVMKHRYKINNIEIVYNKWFVEAFELARQMNLPGCDHHNKLVSGSGVDVLTNDLGGCYFLRKRRIGYY